MSEIATASLPVFPFRINWRAGIAERLEWKTDVLGDFIGNEQRRSLRLTPRREFEVTLSLWGSDRQFWDLWLHRMAGTEFLFPIWHDSVRATQEAAEAQNTIWVDTTALEFGIGSYGLLRGLTATSFERFQIAELYDDHIVTVEPLLATWRKGSRVEPLVRGRMTDQTSVTAINSRVSESQAVLQTTHDASYDEGVDGWDQFEDMPVLAITPNRSEDVSAQYEWAFSESDSLTGRRFRKSDTGRAILHQKHNWLLKGREAKRLFRQLCYRLRGSTKPFWLPTFNEDLTLTRNVAAAGASIYVETVGWAYTGGVSSGREYICIQKRDGTRLYRKITGTAASGSLAEERLTVAPAFPGGLSMADVSRISYMDTARFENDRIEMSHINAADGVTTVSGIFQTFRNERVAPSILQLPIPAAAKGVEPCGPDAPETDICAPVFPGWYLKVFHGSDDPCSQQYNSGYFASFTPFQANPPYGKILNALFAQPTTIYENNSYNENPLQSCYQNNDDPGCRTQQGQLLFAGDHISPYVWVYTFYVDYPGGSMTEQIQYPAFLCSSIGKDTGTGFVAVQRWDWPAPMRVLDYTLYGGAPLEITFDLPGGD